MLNKYVTQLCVMIMSVLISLPLSAQEHGSESTNNDRHKIGLVLGGGSARGMAHVGVLKVLEEMNIPIDAIAGTSKGAIIGGLYASGMSADQIEAILKSVDWEDVFIDDPARPALSFRRKQDDLSFLIDFDLGVSRKGFLLPKGLVQGQKQNRIFRKALKPVLLVDDFDQLPIPFRAVATDISNGQAVILKSGSLVDAMRASMSIPAAFAPVEINGRLLVDGGISNNLPIDVVQQMGVDILIVIDVSENLKPKEALVSPIDITHQVTSVFIKQNMNRLIETLSDRDILIRPKMHDIGSTDFHRIKDAIEAGAEATRQHYKQLTGLAIEQHEYRQYQENLQKAQQEKSISIDFVRIVSDAAVSAEVIKAQMQIKEGDLLDLDALEKDIARIYGMKYFELVDAKPIHKEGETGLEVIVRSKSWGPNYLHFGMNFSDDFGGGSEYNFITRFTKTELNASAAEWRTDLQIGEEPKLWSEFYQPLAPGSRYFIAPSIRMQQSTVNYFAQSNRVAEFRLTERSVDFDIGRVFGNWGELRTGVMQGDGTVRLRTGDPEVFVPEREFDLGQYFFQFRYDSLDNVRFPTQGARLEFGAHYSRQALSAEQDYDLYRMSWIKAASNGSYSLVTRFAAGTVSNNDPNRIESQFELGGFLNLSGLNSGELVGPHFAIANLIAFRKLALSDDAVFNVPIYIGASLELGNVWQTKQAVNMDNSVLAGSLFVGSDTFLGPIYLAGGLSEGGNTGLYFFLGRNF